jgi:hypothetical protein
VDLSPIQNHWLKFQFTRLHKARHAEKPDTISQTAEFQFTRLHKARPRGGMDEAQLTDFNSRAYTRRDILTA